ncbi:MAG TPA: HAD family hydrolase, partial [Egibacteraceae bacterium]|nr:HAD family hydrolase [Egibacteraceae bacterium]
MEPTTGPTERRIDAVVFDMDGVVTDTARVHFAAWKLVFDELLGRLAGGEEPTEPFTFDDYLRDVDGKARYDGVASFLESRGITLPLGQPTDDPEQLTVYGLGKRKDDYFLAALDEQGAVVFDDAVVVLDAARDAGKRLAVVSASENCDV